jgi:acetyl esterase/lipase
MLQLIMASFDGILGTLRLLRIRFLVLSLRLLIRLLSPAIKSEPDTTIQIPSREKGVYIKTNVYKPSQQNHGGGPTPVLINFFGSGLAMPLHGLDDPFCRRIANETGHTVVDVAYRLAPEHPFPAAVHDVEDAVRYVLSHPKLYDLSKVSISGFSSGGTLALVACQLFPRLFVSLVAFYPATNLAVDPALRKPPVPAKPRSPYWTRIFRAGYIRDADPRDPRISPIFADVDVYPRQMMVFTGERDTSALEAEEVAERARKEGQRNVVSMRMKGVGHAFDKRPKTTEALQATEEAYGLVVEMLKSISLQQLNISG